ncbi:MAG TPA: tyrosine-type recombinase/integrase [Kineosporiaceae bacterium]|jgi:integrase|nr:tyrosine-type recombinase/integrase [Kineosporiaceae bacterium]
MSADLRASALEYLGLRRAMGYRLDRHDGQIGQFLDYLEVRHSGSITVEHALAWACLPGECRSRWHAARLAAIRGFAAYVHAGRSDDAELIPTGLIPSRVEHAVPYLYTAEQITGLIRQARTLKPLVRGLTLATVIGLMASTGIRIGEALSLDATSFDARRAQLTVTGKYQKVRRLPIHSSTAAALTNYLQVSRRLVGPPKDQALFLTLNATRARMASVERAFRVVTTSCALRVEPGNKQPRLHDLRHTFAVNTLIDAHRDGVDVDARIAALASYLGHVSPSSTYWYLTASPELLDIVAQRVETHRRDYSS